MDADKMRREILSFTLDDCERGSQGYTRVLLQLFGSTGHGKSSLINSCIYTLSDREYRMYAETGITYGGKTMNRTLYNLTHTIAMVDNRGYPRMEGMHNGEIFAQLANLVPLNRRVEWPKNFEEMMTNLEQGDPNFSDFIVPVYVHSAESVLPEEEMENIRTFIRTCRNMTGVVLFIVLTHKEEDNVRKMEKAFLQLGADRIFTLENYTDDDHWWFRAKDEQILKFLYNAVQEVKYQMKVQRNPERERKECKQFLLKYFHDQDNARKEERYKIATRELTRIFQNM